MIYSRVCPLLTYTILCLGFGFANDKAESAEMKYEWSYEPIVIPVTGGGTQFPKVAVSSDGTKAVALYNDYFTGVYVAAARIMGNTMRWGQSIKISNYFTPQGEGALSISISKDGNRALALSRDMEQRYADHFSRDELIASIININDNQAVIAHSIPISKFSDSSYYAVGKISGDGAKASIAWSQSTKAGFWEPWVTNIFSRSIAVDGDHYSEGEIKTIFSADLNGSFYAPNPPVMDIETSIRGDASQLLWGYQGGVYSSDGSTEGEDLVWSQPVEIYKEGGSVYSISESSTEDQSKSIAIWSISGQSNGVWSALRSKQESEGWGKPYKLDNSLGSEVTVSIDDQGYRALAAWGLGADGYKFSKADILDNGLQWNEIARYPSDGYFTNGSVSVSGNAMGGSVIGYGYPDAGELPLNISAMKLSDNGLLWTSAPAQKIRVPNGASVGYSGSGRTAVAIWVSDAKLYSSVMSYGFELSVEATPGGSVEILGVAQPCKGSCSYIFNNNQEITFSAIADNGYSFLGWGGPCSGDGACTVTMNEAKSVTASFLSLKSMTITKTGNGTITSSPAGINCGSICSGQFVEGSSVSLIAQPDDGYAFDGWGEACAGAGTCTVTMDANKSVSAKFIKLPQHLIKITKPSTGVISSEPAGILCGGPNRQCSSSFTSAKLTATPNAGFEFIKWNGCQAPEGNICYIKPTGKMTVSAVFKKLPKYTLKITKNTLGSITSSPGGLNCPDKKKSCSVKLVKGTQVTLTPVPQAGRTFVGWSGACSGIDPCTLLIDGNKGVGATFQ